MDPITAAPLSDVLATLGVDPRVGLSGPEVQKRTEAWGPNEVAEAPPRRLLSFLRKFWGLSAWMLELILGISALLGRWSEVAVVGALLLLNAILGFLQEQRATGAVEALQERLHVRSRVLRDGTWELRPARDLVPGDVLRLRAGDIVPAELRLLDGRVTVDQSSLTGESADVDRATGDLLLAGSVLRRGEGTALTVATGVHTLFGRTTELVKIAHPKLHIEEVVGRVVRGLFVIVGVVVALVLVLSAIRGDAHLDLLPLLLVLLMSAVPVALPVMFTVSTAIGASELASRGVLVTRLSAAEDAATLDVLCVDKTGTITENRLSLADLLPEEGTTESELLRAAAAASEPSNQDPIDDAILKAAALRDLGDHPGQRRVAFEPFDPQNRRTTAVLEEDGRRFEVSKGALHVIATLCGLSPSRVAALDERARVFATTGCRSLAVASSHAGGMALLGVLTLRDPPRADAAALIAELLGLGVDVKMLTGDALPVAQGIAASVGLSGVRPVSALKSPVASAGGSATSVPDTAGGFAELYPEDKYDVVRYLQAAGHVVGMTGDGVNDAPALRQAEVGIAVRDATDVARSAASVILTEPGLVNIVALVEQGRIIYQRILTWVVNKVSRTLLKSAFVALAYVFTGRFVVSAFAMLLLVFMTDFAKIALATDRVRWSQKPETWRIGRYILVATLLGVAMVAEALALLALAWSPFGLAANSEALSTFSFETLLYFAVFSIVSARERRWFWSSRPGRTLVLALLGDLVVGTMLASVGLPGLVALPWWQTAVVLAAAVLACLGLNDALKVGLLRWTGATLQLEKSR